MTAVAVSEPADSRRVGEAVLVPATNSAFPHLRRLRFAKRRPIRLPAGATSILCLALATVLTGCTHLGPKTIAVDRFDYSSAIADSWKQQTLLNIVKLRYMDLPVFVDVASIVAGYSMQTGVNVGGTASSRDAIQGNFVAAGAQAIYTDRPTITYVPLTGEKFLRGLITPIDPKNIFFMVQAGYPARSFGPSMGRTPISGRASVRRPRPPRP